MTSQLSPEDQARVDSVINSGGYQGERKPFRPWMLLAVIMLVMAALSGLSYLIAKLQGVV